MKHDRISWDPHVMSGKPVIRGTRIPVVTLLRWLGRGVTIEALLEQYPSLTREDVLAAQLFAADFIADEHLVTAAE